MTDLVALDWGTSSLRVARLRPDGTVLEEHASTDGILAVPAGGFPSVFERVTARWSLAPGQLCLASGMVGSRQGWQEAPYCPCPAGFDDLARHVAWVPDAPGGVRLGLVPGLSFDAGGVPDVLRGEEIQVMGALALLGQRDGLFVLPGTHSKWVRVEAGRITRFSTFMTGEVYALLRKQSILARTMPADDGPLDPGAFLRGVAHARKAGSLLHAAFSARTLALFDALPTALQPSYLSGLLVGEELRAQVLSAGEPVVLIGSDKLTQGYALALQSLGVPSRRLADAATWRGLAALAATLDPRP
ncbi:MAG: 2-dehydro-3-deoxygalactonokinase [Comamonadaceae bacterium]|nr:MAG: 2-dehydro-3-deoxygalactonokinase [Comamonadaceae bacterium]